MREKDVSKWPLPPIVSWISENDLLLPNIEILLDGDIFGAISSRMTSQVSICVLITPNESRKPKLRRNLTCIRVSKLSAFARANGSSPTIPERNDHNTKVLELTSFVETSQRSYNQRTHVYLCEGETNCYSVCKLASNNEN